MSATPPPGDGEGLEAELEQSLEAVARALRDARSVLWITGAGISADSGLPTYRGIGGLYEERDTIDGMPVEVALSGEVFRDRPELTWRYIAEIEQACRGARPNRAHEVIALAERHFARSVVLTQNVDGLHRAAGAREVIDIHGDLRELMCTACDWRERRESFAGLELPPRCPACGAVVRPDVVLFGELLPEAKLARLRRELLVGFDAVFSIGTTSVFPYISEPVLQARRRGALTVEINPGESEVSHVVAHRIRARAAPALSRLWEKVTAGSR